MLLSFGFSGSALKKSTQNPPKSDAAQKVVQRKSTLADSRLRKVLF
jgi:hypothetical protein